MKSYNCLLVNNYLFLPAAVQLLPYIMQVSTEIMKEQTSVIRSSIEKPKFQRRNKAVIKVGNSVLDNTIPTFHTNVIIQF